MYQLTHADKKPGTVQCIEICQCPYYRLAVPSRLVGLPRNIRRANTFLCCPTTESFCRTVRIARAEHTILGAGRDPEMIARNAGISPETLRKVAVGRMPSPSFGTVIGLCNALGLPLQTVDAWRGTDDQRMAI